MNKLDTLLDKISADKEHVYIDKLIEYISTRIIANHPSSSSYAFINGFYEFISQCEDGTIDYNNNPYRDWIDSRFKYHITYMGKTKNQFNYEERFDRDKQLYFSIKENGLREPIKIFKERNYIEVDGHHRLVICKFLGYDKIKFRRV